MNKSPALPDSAPNQPASRPTTTRAWQRVRDLFSVEGLWFGLAACVMALHAESILMPNGMPASHPDFGAATRWYVFSVLILLIGWWGNYSDVSMLRIPARGARATGAWVRDRAIRMRLATFAVGLVVNLIAVEWLRHDWYSAVGGWLWAVGLLLLVVAGIREGDDGAPAADTAKDRTTDGWRLRPWVEIGLVMLILALAITMRFWRLNDLLPGMHGDEGEAGSSALNILNGVPTSPFLRGWFNQYNVFFWSVALFMKVLGANLVGLRMFAVLCGVITTGFVYLIAREMFGVRAALFAGAFMAFQSADLLFSRMVMTNTAAPTTSVISYYFLIRGLRTRKHLDFVIAGIAGAFGVYYYAGGRLEVPIAVVFLAYLAIFHRTFLRAYWTRVLAFVLAAGATVTPFLANLMAYPIHTTDYPNNRFVWLNYDVLVQTYGTTSWPTILWDQLQRSLSLLTYSIDSSANNILNYPPVRPIEAALIVLGLGWAAVRFRDTRFGLLNIWFWATVLAGGVLTVDHPNLPRICAALPVLPLVMAAILDRFAAQVAVAVERVGQNAQWRTVGQWIGGTIAAGAVAIAGGQNWQMYINTYLNTHQNPNVTGQAMFVRDHGLHYRYYDMGHPLLYFTHGDNRFINYGADGIDAVNPSDTLPVIDNGPTGEKDAIFMIWSPMYSYLPIVQAYYPEAHLQIFPLGDAADPARPLDGLIIPHEVIDKHRTLLARYIRPDGNAVTRREPNLGTPATLPPGLRFPVRASWAGGLVAPTYDTYHFYVAAPPGTTLAIDGKRVVSVHRRASTSDAVVDLARGIHDVRLVAHLGSPQTRVRVFWRSSTLGRAPISHIYLWDNHVSRQWFGQTTPIAGAGAGVVGLTQPVGSPEARFDGFIGFRSTAQAFGINSGIQGMWMSNLAIHRPGLYRFQLNALEGATLTVDGQAVVNDPAVGAQPQAIIGTIQLRRGIHHVRITYTWQSGVGYLELFWQPPGQQQMQLMLTPNLRPDHAGMFPARTAPKP